MRRWPRFFPLAFWFAASLAQADPYYQSGPPPWQAPPRAAPWQGPPPPFANIRDRSRLDDAVGPEERRRLRRELRDYAREAYPDRERMEAFRRQQRRDMRQRMRQADEDRDGAYSRGEVERRMPGWSPRFGRLDLNGDGVVTQDELRAARQRQFNQR